MDFLICAQPGGQTNGFKRPLQKLTAEFACVFLMLVFQEITDRRTRFRSNRIVQPQWSGHCGSGRQYLHVIAVPDRLMQRYGLVVDACSDTVITDIRVHRVGKVQRARAFGQFLDVPMGGEHIDLIRVKIDLEVLKKLGRITGLVLGIEQIQHPMVGGRLRAGTLLSGLVLPV